jgi:YedE family putative selenium metabolism protein
MSLARFAATGGGDLNAITGLAGLIVGIIIGVQFLKSGYNLGRTQKTYPVVGWLMPGLMILLLVFRLVRPKFGEGAAIFFSESGPGSLYAPLLLSLVVGLLIGFLAQRTRFCTMGSIRDVILMGDTHLISGVGTLLVTAFVVNLILGQETFGFAPQPVAHSSHLWNFLGMALSGLAFTLAGGCPGRQLFLAGEGDGDSGVFVLGMIVGAGISHNFLLAGRPDALVEGVLQVGCISSAGMLAVIFGLAVCLVIGFTMREKLS